jgi:uncharacterized repeat protein (TIGR02543 family)
VYPAGAGIIDPDTVEYEYGSEVTLKAIPFKGYTFDHWNGDISGTSETITFRIYEHKNITANFKVAQRKLFVLADPAQGGNITCTPENEAYDHMTRVTICAEPASGYSFDHWSGDTAGTSLSMSITMDEDKIITAHFKSAVIEIDLLEGINQGLINVNASGSGSLNRISISIKSNSDKPLKIILTPGILFKSSSSSVQSMISLARREISIEPQSSRLLDDIASACVDMLADVPRQYYQLSVQPPPDNQDLMSLLNLADLRNESYRIKQFAIWTITDNPGRNQYVGIGYQLTGSGPSSEELIRIRMLFQKAGISTSKYNALR